MLEHRRSNTIAWTPSLGIVPAIHTTRESLGVSQRWRGALTAAGLSPESLHFDAGVQSLARAWGPTKSRWAMTFQASKEASYGTAHSTAAFVEAADVIPRLVNAITSQSLVSRRDAALSFGPCRAPKHWSGVGYLITDGAVNRFATFVFTLRTRFRDLPTRALRLFM